MKKILKDIFDFATSWRNFGIIYLIAFLFVFKKFGLLTEGFYHVEFWLIPIYATSIYLYSMLEDDSTKRIFQLTVETTLILSLIKTSYFTYFTLKPFDLKNDCAIIFFIIMFASFWIPSYEEKWKEFKEKFAKKEDA